MRRFSLCSCYWLGALVLTLAAATSGANAQGTLNVSASASATDWAAVSTDENPATLSASVNNPPTAASGCTLNPPNWSWIIETTDDNKVQYSPDGISWSASGGFSAWIVQPDPTLPTAYLHVIFMFGGYWQFPCRTSVSYSDTCGSTWSGGALATALPKSVKLLGLTVVSGATQTNVTGATNWAAVKKAGDKVIAKASIQPDNEDAAAKIQWTNGTAVVGNLLRRSVDKGTSATTQVTAKIGPDQYSVNIWILWATIVNQVTDTTPANAVQFGASYTPRG